MKFKCPHCQCVLEGDDTLAGQTVSCGSCNREFVVSQTVVGISEPETNFYTLLGVEKLHGFTLGRFFAQVFRAHSRDEAEDVFACGTVATTPPIGNIRTVWPMPWLFSRIFLFGVLLMGILLVFLQKYSRYQESAAWLGAGVLFTIIGAFTTPVATMILLFECNIPRNISSFAVIKWFFLGGCISMFLTLFIHELPLFSDLTRSGIMGASIAGLTEEPAKLLAVVLLAGGVLKYRYRINGLIIGAAVGAGFAAFETLGYITLMSMADESGAAAWETMILRGLVAPFMHVLWTAITAWALWRVKGDRKFRFSMFLDKRFLKVFVCSVILHIVWNSEWAARHGFWVFGIIGVAGWFIAFLLMQDGIQEIHSLKEQTPQPEVVAR